MPNWTLELEFGGLCLFVKRDSGNAPGLFVLMPRTHEPYVHLPLLEYGGKNEPKVRASLDGTISNLRDLSDGSSTPAKIPDDFAAVSSFASALVLEKWLTGTGASGALAARIELPVDATLESFGDPGQMHPDIPNPISRPYRGRAVATINDIPEDKNKIKIGGATIYLPQPSGTIRVRLLNVPEDQLDCPRMGKHRKGGHSPHFDHYYNLLGPGRRPKLIFDQDTEEETDCEEALRFHADFVDPFACTIAYACPPEGSPDCES